MSETQTFGEGHRINPVLKAALQYVRNTNGGATRAHFFEDHEPVGPLLWDDLSYPCALACERRRPGYVRTDEAGRIHLTAAGDHALDQDG